MKEVKPETIHIPENHGIPNHPDYPALVYKGVLDSDKEDNFAEAFEQRYRRNGWGGCWRWGVYDFHHFHSTAHEALGVARGQARLRIGGPDGKLVEVEAGDVLVLPAGTGHKNEGSSAGFQVVGAYPHGQENYDMIRGGGDVSVEIRDNISNTAVPETDPLFGSSGPLRDLWK